MVSKRVRRTVVENLIDSLDSIGLDSNSVGVWNKATSNYGVAQLVPALDVHSIFGDINYQFNNAYLDLTHTLEDQGDFIVFRTTGEMGFDHNLSPETIELVNRLADVPNLGLNFQTYQEGSGTLILTSVNERAYSASGKEDGAKRLIERMDSSIDRNIRLLGFIMNYGSSAYSRASESIQKQLETFAPELKPSISTSRVPRFGLGNHTDQNLEGLTVFRVPIDFGVGLLDQGGFNISFVPAVNSGYMISRDGAVAGEPNGYEGLVGFPARGRTEDLTYEGVTPQILLEDMQCVVDLPKKGLYSKDDTRDTITKMLHLATNAQHGNLDQSHSIVVPFKNLKAAIATLNELELRYRDDLSK